MITPDGIATEIDAPIELDPSAVETFLGVTGWSRSELRDGVYSIWENRDARARLLLPYDPEYRDFPLRFSEALNVLSQVHHLRGQALAMEIASARSDILLLRADQYSVDGSIPLQEAQGLLDSAHKMLLAAACAAIAPRASFAGRKPNAAREFLAEDVRMGHTMRGSFVITILTRLDEGDEPLPELDAGPMRALPAHTVDDQYDLSFNRRVMTTLATGMSAVEELLTPHPSIDLNEAVELGASAEMLESVASISSFEGLRGIDLSFRWSSSHALPGNDVPDRVELPRVDVERVGRLRDTLRRRPPVEHDQVIGQVVRLERQEGSPEGIVVVDGYVARSRRRVKVELRGEAYRLAVRSHETQSPVIVAGKITHEKRSYWIRTVTRFETLDN